MVVFFSLLLILALLLLPIFGIIWLVTGIMKRDAWKIKAFFFGIFSVALISLAGVVACSCSHQWCGANCLTPRTCLRCNVTEEALGEHQWENGTCTTAAVCTLCNEVQPEPTGHNWQDATCQQAQHCRNCAEEVGEPAGCEYQDGICIYCEESEVLVWIPQTGERYPTNPDCSNMIDPTEVTITAAQDSGFTPCQKCYG